jgi:hypothetical protein
VILGRQTLARFWVQPNVSTLKGREPINEFIREMGFTKARGFRVLKELPTCGAEIR